MLEAKGVLRALQPRLIWGWGVGGKSPFQAQAGALPAPEEGRSSCVGLISTRHFI